MIALTSFSGTGYRQYGEQFLEKAVKFWPTPLVVYYEVRPDFIHDKVTYKNLFEIKELVTFLGYMQDKPVCRGQLEEGYNYNFDAWKFCRKSFAQFDALRNYKGKVFWLDADIEFKEPITEKFLEGLFDGKTLACLWREGFYTETGFIGFDTEGEKFQEFLTDYENVYRKGKLFTLERWHDCMAFDYAVKSSGVPFKNLSKFYKKNETTLDVLSQSVLRKYMKHHKGPNKDKLRVK